MRVNPNPMNDLLAALAQTQQRQDTALLQLSTGKRVNTPSDDPAAAAQLIQNHDQSSRVDSYQKSMSTIGGQFQMADSALSSVVTALQRAITLGVQAGNGGTLSDSNRAAIADELKGIQSQLLSLANTSYQGRYVFSGTEQTQPFVVDSNQTSGVRYDGNSGVNSVPIGNGYQLEANLPGSQLFTAAGADVFQAVHDLIDGVTSNSGIDTAVGDVRSALDHVSAQRTFYGNALNQIDAQTNYLNNEKVQLSSQENTLVGADIATVASNLVNAENTRDAALTAIGRRSLTSLFDYLQ